MLLQVTQYIINIAGKNTSLIESKLVLERNFFEDQVSVGYILETNKMKIKCTVTAFHLNWFVTTAECLILLGVDKKLEDSPKFEVYFLGGQDGKFISRNSPIGRKEYVGRNFNVFKTDWEVDIGFFKVSISI